MTTPTDGAVAKTDAPAPTTAPVAPPAPIVTAPAPVAPAPAQPPAPASKPDDAAAILKQLAAEREALAAEREALRREYEASKAYREQDIAAERRRFVRDLPGLAVDFPDHHLDMLIPRDADPRTEAGKAKLIEWREKGGARYFAGPAPAPAFDAGKFAEEVVGGAKNADRRLFGARHVRSMLGE